MKKSVKFIKMGNRIWKFLKMHLRLDTIYYKKCQWYSDSNLYLIADLLLGLIKLPKELGNKLLNKFRFVLTLMKEKKSFVHWFREIILIQ